jgi:glycosyltransferase involved in cell wall biosynthesis
MTFHRSLGFESAKLSDRLRNLLAGLASRRIVTASVERRDHYVRENWISPSKVLAIPLGIDLARFCPDPIAKAQIRRELNLDPETTLAVSVGHFGEEKGIDLAIATVAAARLAMPAGRIYHAILGSGGPDQLERMASQASRIGGAETTLLGFRPDPERWLAAADLLVHTPRVEAFGLVIVQAMACGTPVAATAVGGIPEIVVDGRTGLLGQPGEIDELGGRIARLLADQKRLAEQAAGALERARREYAASVYAARHASLYAGFLRGGS